MQIIHGYDGLTLGQRGASVALGNFDGVHRGHGAVIAAAKALVPGAPSGVVTFDPHPRRFFQPEADPFILTPLPVKAERIAALGAAFLYVLRFDAALAAMTPDDFVKTVLVDGLGVAGVATGSDFRFGVKRGGDAPTMSRLGERFGFATDALSEVYDESGGTVSSSAARQALREGRPEDATAILGAPHVIRGAVLAGDKRGRTIGFPTANLSLEGILVPAFGVYAITTRFADGRTARGVANLGMRPTFDKTVPILEAHLFDFDRDIYGETASVSLHRFIRPERRFDGLDALKTQIALDVEAAQAAPI